MLMFFFKKKQNGEIKMKEMTYKSWVKVYVFVCVTVVSAYITNNEA